VHETAQTLQTIAIIARQAFLAAAKKNTTIWRKRMPKKQQGVIGQVFDQVAQDIARDIAKNAAGAIIDLKHRVQGYKNAAGEATMAFICGTTHQRIVKVGERKYRVKFIVEPLERDDDSDDSVA
jgi:hypothetical protein